jgi:hypothetical protein
VQIIASSFHDFGASSHAPVLTAGLFHRALVGKGVEASLLEFNTSPHRIDESVKAAITTFLTKHKEKTNQ